MNREKTTLITKTIMVILYMQTLNNTLKPCRFSAWEGLDEQSEFTLIARVVW